MPASVITDEPRPAQAPVAAKREAVNAPSQTEISALISLSFVIFVVLIWIATPYLALVENFGDSGGYINLASAIRHWDFQGVIVKQFWGLSYAMALLSKVTGLSDRTALLTLSLLPSLASGLLVRRLWDGWIAGYFAVLNFDWLQRSCLGGSEPLFVFLIFFALLSARRERWLVASLLASLATVVRPLGFFALAGIGIALLMKRDFRRVFATTAIGLLVGILYAVPLATHFGDPLANVNSYHSSQWQGGWLFGFPFYAIIKGTILYRAPWTNLVLSFGWIFLVLAGVAAMIGSSQFRSYARTHVVETVFLIGYLWCLFTYNYPHWARSNFPRFAIPIVTFVLFALYRWIPKDRRLLWPLAVLMPMLAASSALGIVNVAHMLRAAIAR